MKFAAAVLVEERLGTWDERPQPLCDLVDAEHSWNDPQVVASADFAAFAAIPHENSISHYSPDPSPLC